MLCSRAGSAWGVWGTPPQQTSNGPPLGGGLGLGGWGGLPTAPAPSQGLPSISPSLSPLKQLPASIVEPQQQAAAAVHSPLKAPPPQSPVLDLPGFAAPPSPVISAPAPTSSSSHPSSPGNGAAAAKANGHGSSAAAAPSSSGPYVVRCKGLPLSVTIDKITAFFDGIEIAKAGGSGGVRLTRNDQGMPTGECLVVFASESAMAAGLEKNRQVMGHRYVTVERASAAELAKAGGGGGGGGGAAAPASSRAPGSRSGSQPASPSKPVLSAGHSPVIGGGSNGHSSANHHYNGNGSNGTAAVDISDSVVIGNGSGHRRGGSNGSGGYAEAASARGGGGGGVNGNGASLSVRGSNGIAASAANNGHATAAEEPGGAAASAGGGIVIKMRGLPYSTGEEEIRTFFRDLKIVSNGVSIGRDAQGRASGEAHVEFASEQDAQSGMLFNRHRIGSRYIELFRTKQAPGASARGGGKVVGGGGVAGNGNGNAADASSAATSGGAAAAAVSDCLRLRGMPFNSTEADVLTFFKGYALIKDGIKIGPQVGQGTVRFATAEDARKALVSLNHSYMGSRYIELFFADKNGEYLSR